MFTSARIVDWACSGQRYSSANDQAAPGVLLRCDRAAPACVVYRFKLCTCDGRIGGEHLASGNRDRSNAFEHRRSGEHDLDRSGPGHGSYGT